MHLHKIFLAICFIQFAVDYVTANDEIQLQDSISPNNDVFIPGDIEIIESSTILEIGKKETVTVKKTRNLYTHDTIAVQINCENFTYSPSFSDKTVPISTCVSIVKTTTGEHYGDFAWYVTKESNEEYTVKKKDYILVLFPGTYTITNDGINKIFPGDFEVLPTSDEVDPRLRTSVVALTSSTVDISFECFKVPSGMIDPDFPELPSPSIGKFNYDVGSAFGSYGVSEIGSATYDCLIEMPKHQFTPQVGISYNSQLMGYGLVGYGINISGISRITRTGKNLFYDNDYKGITYTDDDNLLLDGKRLIPNGNATYTIEGSPFSIVTKHGSGSQSWFSVTDNGITYEYGKDQSAKNIYHNAKGEEHIAEWYVCRATDSNGNYMTYNYENIDLMIYPIRIIYGLHTQATNSESSAVEFEYQDLGSNSQPFIIEDQKGIISKCLKSITTSTSGSVFRKYSFAYDNSSDKSCKKYTRLKTITVSNGSGGNLSPVEFTWNYLPGIDLSCSKLRDEIANNNSSIVEKNNLYFSSDINSDGISDLIKLSLVAKAGEMFYDSYIHISQSKRDINGKISYGNPMTLQIPSVRDFENMASAPYELPSIVDLDGDGYNDLIFTYHFNFDYDMSDRYWIIYGKEIARGQVGPLNFEIPLESKTEKSLMTFFDVDGDGKDEIIFLDTSNINGEYHGGMIDHENYLKAHNKVFKFNFTSVPTSMFSADYNNDGLLDLLFVHDNGYDIYYNNGGTDRSGLFTESNKFSSSGFEKNIRMTQGDFNGDGLIDFVYYLASQKKLAVAKNNGNGTFTVDYSDAIGISLSETSIDQNLTVCDFDHDGCSDAIVTIKKSDGYIKILWLYSDGSTLRLKSEFTSYNSSGGIKIGSSIFCGDFDGDGAEELANLGAQLNANTNGYAITKFNVYHSPSKAYAENKIISVADGSGKYISFNYSCLTNPEVYSWEKSLYPLKSFYFPMSVVKSTDEYNGDAEKIKTNYKYETLKFHVTGRGSLGFSSMEETNETTGIKRITKTQKWDSKWYVPLETLSQTIVGKDTLHSTQSNNIVTIGQNYFTYPSIEKTIDLDGNETRTDYNYDNSTGLLMSKKTSYDGEDMYKMVAYSDYENIGNKWLPKTIENTWKHRDDPDVFTTRTTFIYDQRGNVAVKNDNYGTDLTLTTLNLYDKRGNITATISSGNGVVPVEKTFKFDNNERFLIGTSSTPKSAEIAYSYDLWGNLLTETDLTDPDNKLVRSMTYDGWGKKLSEIAPDGTKTTYNYGWGLTDEYRSYITVEQSDCADETRWFDSLGRERLIKTLGQGDIELATITNYNSKNQISNIESYAGLLVIDKTYTYDQRGRTISISNAGQTTDYTYGNRKVIATTNGRSKTSWTDAWGNVISIKDPIMTVNYEYSSNGKPVKIMTEDCTVTMKYDAVGNQIELDDPDAGKNLYTYAADGSIMSQTDGRGISTEYTFDNLGRIYQVKIGEKVVTNTYGTSGTAMQRIVRRSDGNNHIDYTYDKYGRVIKENRTVAGQETFSYEFEYNIKGQLSKVIYPGGLEVTYIYDRYGNKLFVKANNTKIWSFKKTNGKKTESLFMNSLKIIQIVDDFGHISDLKIDDANAPINLNPDVVIMPTEKLSINRNSITGNVTTKTYQYGLTSYTYDEMDRLTSVRSRRNRYSIEYANNGNITYKSNVGDYEYLGSQPHAVTGITNPSELIPSSVQSVSFNELGKVAKIEEDELMMTFDYGPDGERWTSCLFDGETTVRSTVYAGTYEKICENGINREFYYIGDNIIIIKQDGVFTPYYAFADEQGTILSVYDKNQTQVFSATYDEWGRQEVTKNEIGLHRGYTAHEMLPEFGIINMNGRLYDPVLGRFFSPDNYVQQPTNSQNFNRYTYCLNNPLKYTDPSGEWFGIDDLIVSAVGALTGYISNGITTGHWGWSAVKAGFYSAVASYIGYNSIGLLASGKTSLSKYILSMSISNLSNSLLPSISMPINSFMGLSMSPMIGLGEYGLSCGLSMALTFNFGDGWNFSISGGGGNQYIGGNAFVSYKNWGAGYGLTHYYEQKIGDNTTLGTQNVGTISALLGGVSIRFSNDAVSDKHDRWRSNAVEIAYKNYTIGTYVTTNDGDSESNHLSNIDGELKHPKAAGRRKGFWPEGKIYSAPLWIGFKSGNQVYRFGYSCKAVQEYTQNFVHKYIVPTPLFNGKVQNVGIYIYSGYNSPYSLW